MTKVLSRHSVDDHDLFSELVFAVAAHLSGSSFGGRVGDQDIYPVLGYLIGENSQEPLMEGGIGMTSLVNDVISELSTNNAES